MSIRFYFSDVEPAQTAQEIQQMLAQRGAQRVAVTYEDGPEAVEFVLEVDGRSTGFRVQPDVDGMHRALQDDEDAVEHSRTSREQAARTAWRTLQAWIEVQLNMRDARQAPLDQLLLGYGITQTGETIYERLVEDRALLQPPDRT